MASLRAMAQCIGLNNTNNFSVIRDFYGYIRGAPQPLSLLTQIRRLQGRHIHLNCIRVGSDQFTNNDLTEIDSSVEYMRTHYAQANIGVGRVSHFVITTAQANGHENIDNDAEAEQLTSEWTVPNDAYDVFFVLTYAGNTNGYSPVHGPCDKDAKGMNGSVVEVASTAFSPSVAAHEVGHYMGLDSEHSSDPNNLMYAYSSRGGNLTDEQGQRMRDHCFVKGGC